MIKKFVKSLNSNIYLTAAEALGAEIRIIDEELDYSSFNLNGKTVYVLGNVLSVNSHTSNKISKNKYTSAKLLQKILGKMIPDNRLFTKTENTYEEILEYVKSKSYKVVLKPLELSSAKGVHVLPTTPEMVKDAVDNIFNNYNVKELMVEDYVAGKEYRIVGYRGKIINVVERTPANVIGDGQRTLQQLIDIKNEVKTQNGLALIYVDNELLNLNNQTLEYIPAEGEAVTLNKVCNLGKGGDVNDVPVDSINPVYHDVMNKICFDLPIDFSGVDLITPDITQDPYSNNSALNEINSAPMPDATYYANIGSSDPLKQVRELITEIAKV